MAFTITYEYPTTEFISSVKVDGVAATVRTTAALVDANPGSFYNDRANSLLYVSAATGSVFGKSVIAVADLTYSTKSKTFNNLYYDPRISTVPSLSMRIEKEFGGVGQISGGNLELINTDSELDSRSEYLWDNSDSKVTMKIGYDTRTEEMAYSDYVAFGVWAVESWQSGDDKFTLDLKEIKVRLDSEIPFEAFDTATYSGMDVEDVGNPIPRAYGQIYGARAILTDASTKNFKVAGHAIKSLDAVRLLIDDVWTASSFTTTNLATGEFTCSAWVDGYEISVDFKGRKNAADDSLMDNAANIVEDLLLYAGVPAADIDSDAIDAAYERLDYGYDPEGLRKTVRAVSLYLNDYIPLVDVLGQVNEVVGSFIFVDAAGQYNFGVFEPTVSEDMTSYDETDCLSFDPETDSSKLVSKILAKYAHRRQDEWWGVITEERTANQFEHNAAKETVITSELPELSAQDDAEYWAQRKLVSDGLPLKTYKITLPAKGLATLPGDQIRVSNSRRAFNEVLEVLEVGINLSTATASLTCGNLRNWGADAGFWVDTLALPTRFASETGYSTGATSLDWNILWSDTIKAWAKQNVGYWTDANGFADPADPDSFIPSTWF
tara:strand:- start:922 stop:2742 length:1821 start_codon:yes stop_codon:yes gene_type:complete